MGIDLAKIRFDQFFVEWKASQSAIINESDTRFQMIDRMLIEVMEWKHLDIRTERHSSSGYADYLLSRDNRSYLVIEAKKKDNLLIDTRNPNVAHYKVGGSALKSAEEGIKQARKYCVDVGVSFAALTTGIEWIFFTAIRTDGRPPAEGKAIVFPNLQSINKNFAKFYDLLSKSGCDKELIRVRLQEAEGLEIISEEELYSIQDPQKARFMKKSQIAQDLNRVFDEFFGTISGNNDTEMLSKCFVETKESREADTTLDKITRKLTNDIQVVNSRGVALAKRIEAAVESRRGEFVLVIGNKGAGKSTFIDRFFKLVLENSLRKQCLVVKVDLTSASSSLDTLDSWLTNCLKKVLERELFDSSAPKYEELQGIFWKDYQRWKVGEHKFLYKTNRNEFKIKFGEYIYNLAKEQPKKYIIELLRHSIKSRQLLPCLIFDNTDHYQQTYQEHVFQYAQSIFQEVLSFVICPITDRTIWQLSKQGPLQSYRTTQFYLPVPSTKEVLHKRINFIKQKIEGKSTSGEYFSQKGIRLNLSDIKGFALCLEEIFINTEYLGKIVGWLSNHDIRRGLRISQDIITSPILNIEELLKLYIFKGKSIQKQSIKERKIRQALILGNYNTFIKKNSSFILNVFQVIGTDITTPMATLSILQLLMDKEVSASSPIEPYMTIDKIVNYCEPMGISRSATIKHLKELLEYRLIEPYDPTDSDIYMEQRVRITYAGRIHMDFALKDETYFIQMALATQIRSSDIAVQGRGIFYSGDKMTRSDWLEIACLFANYCDQQDRLFVNIPTVDSYLGQKELRNQFRQRWINKDEIL